MLGSSPPVPPHSGRVSEDFLPHSRNYLDVTQDNERLNATLHQVKPAPAETKWEDGPGLRLEKPPPTNGKCLCSKCVTGQGTCKKYDPWMNYTAWMNFS